MKLHDFAASKSVTLCFITISAVCVYALMAFGEVDRRLRIAALCAFAVLVTLWFTAEYFRLARRMARLRRTIDALPEKYLAGEVLPRPADHVERMYFDIVKTISRAAIGEAEQARRDKEDYCQYVEMWIHEIKTPLTACALILSNGGDVRKLRRELQRADNLTDIILNYARLRTADRDTLIAPVNVHAVADEAAKSQMDILIAAGICVDITGDFMTHTDAKQLLFIIKQLLINSARYCPGSAINIRLVNGVIIYEDNGIGIPANEISRITQRGFTGTNGRRLGSSTGMGMYIVSEMCRHLGITLKTESEIGAFTRFTLTFDSLTEM